MTFTRPQKTSRIVTLRSTVITTFALFALFAATALADDFIPRAQDKPPGPPLSPAEAVAKMTVPEGFKVELVAAEPDVMNPVAMAIDERGRFWITESFEYPRHSAGPGRDRVKILEDTNADGAVDKVTVFMEGLNIPSGIAVGHGGAWVVNAPDLLFVQDTNGDGIADRQEVVVTGFGREDTHELPNALTWGPDGWLYGLNGVFNNCHVKYSAENPNFTADHSGWHFTAAMFRVNPHTKEFQIFCEGTSNPWGIAFDKEGSAFVSACVIDHLWHLVHGGYYNRQAGAYPPHTWKIESIVQHKHQKAAYCGITYFDSPAYPPEYRGHLYMGNIHGGCINVDAIERQGSTYFGTLRPDFMTANDAWFMPVAQKVGPDGALYVLDWYDRYHCYQDANRDPEGIDRGRGRLYRVRYQNAPHAKGFNLGKAETKELLAKLGDPNVFIRETAQLLLQARNDAELDEQLLALIQKQDLPAQQQMHAIFALSGRPAQLGTAGITTATFLGKSMDPLVQSWGLRIAANALGSAELQQGPVEAIESQIAGLVEAGLTSPDPRVQLEALNLISVINSKHISFVSYTKLLTRYLVTTKPDPLLARMAWRTVKAVYQYPQTNIGELIANQEVGQSELGQQIIPRAIDWMLDNPQTSPASLASAVTSLISRQQVELAGRVLKKLAERTQNRELQGDALISVQQVVTPALVAILKTPENNLYLDATMLAASWKNQAGFKAAEEVLKATRFGDDQRIAALDALIAADQPSALTEAAALLAKPEQAGPALRGRILASLGRLDSPAVGTAVIAAYKSLEPELRPRAIELLSQRASWASQLLTAMGDKQIPSGDMNVNQARRLSELGDVALSKLLADNWGAVREGRNPRRDLVVAEMRQLVRSQRGDPFSGEKVFTRVCAQCHKIYGQGAEVGPEVTLNGRNEFNQLLSNIYDPSLVIGASYRSYTIATEDGRVINGLLVEDSPERVVLKVQGGKQEVVPHSDIDVFKVNELSLMPEELEKQMTAKETQDLFAFLTLDKHPSDPTARQLPGVYEVVPRQADDSAEFAQLAAEVAWGFKQVTSGEGGVAIEAEHMGQAGVLRTHPVNPETAAELAGEFAIPSGKRSRLKLSVSHHEQGDWQLIVLVNNEQLVSRPINRETCPNGWQTVEVDLTPYAGQTVQLRLLNQPTGWNNEFAYWKDIGVMSE
jgi:putative membrane-bound dehydrogenase-like protein